MKSHKFAKNVTDFLTHLSLPCKPPDGIDVLLPYASEEVCRVVQQMCATYYSSPDRRIAIWGINPGRFGAGLTGLAFTDPYAVDHLLGITSALSGRRELSAKFVQKVIEQFGGPQLFYRHFYVTALSPLGYIKGTKNLNFYDDPRLQSTLTPQIQSWVREQLEFGIRRDVTIVLGTGKLKLFFEREIRQQCGFSDVIYLEHPRFIMQYRRKRIHEYCDRYVSTLQDVMVV